MVTQLIQTLQSRAFNDYYFAIGKLKSKYPGKYRSWFGVNYSAASITFKFYFTFFEKIEGAGAEALLKSNYQTYLTKLNYIDEAVAYDFYAPGSGITFTWKCDGAEKNQAEGFFFRTKAIENTSVFDAFLADSDLDMDSGLFNSSPGYYFMAKDGSVSEKTYAYLSDKKAIAALSKKWPLAALAECIEIGLSNHPDKQKRMAATKMILLGNYQTIMKTFGEHNQNTDLRELQAWAQTKGCFPLCPGTYPYSHIQSLYFFSPIEQKPALQADAIEKIMSAI